MNAVWALIPLKSPRAAKTRLAPVLAADECALLCRAMFLDMLTAAAGAERLAGIAVLTDDPEIATLAAEAGHTAIHDTSDDLCDGLTAAARELAALGADTLLILPGDIPTVRAADIDALIARHEDGLSICPAIRDGGTNALICSPPDAVPFCFGKDSARRHCEAADARGVPTARIPMPAFFRDIDLPEDLAWLANRDCDSHAVHFLHDSGISARLTPAFLRSASS